MKVLVIGGAGYIGSAVIPILLAGGHSVSLLDLFLYGHAPIREFESKLENIWTADFRDSLLLESAMIGMDAVIHLGSIVGDPACSIDEELSVEIDMLATQKVAVAAREAGVQKFLLSSTCSVYGSGNEILTEQSSYQPLSIYAKAKLASEWILQTMASDTFSPVILRFGTVYGFSGRVRFDLVVNLLTAKAILENKITVFGGDQWRPFIHVEDAARAIVAAVEAPSVKTHNEIFNAGSNAQNYTISEVAEIIKRMFYSARLILSGGDKDKRNYRVNFDKIEKTLKFSPKWTVIEGVKQVRDAINEGITDYTLSDYNNYKFMVDGGIEKLRETVLA